MKVCLSSREIIWGGGEVFLRDLGAELLSRGHDVTWRVEENSELALRIPGGRVVNRRAKVRYDVLIANDFRSFWQALALDGNQRKIFVGHGAWQFSRLRVRLLRATNTATFVVSNSVADDAARKGFPGRPAVLPLGPGTWKKWPQTDVSALAARKEEAFVFGNVARLDPIKRLPLFARCVQELGAKGIIVVPYPTSDEEKELHDHLNSLGHIELRVAGDVDALWSDVDVFFSTSAAESLGLAHLEALQSGVPVISTAAGGPSDFLTGELKTGWIPAADEDSLASAVKSSLNSFKAAACYWEDAHEVLSVRGVARCADALIGAAT